MEKNEEYIAISKHFKGELWSSVKDALLNDGFFTEISFDIYKSNVSGSIYKFVISGRGKDKYVTRIENICDGEIVNSFQKTCEPNKEEDVEKANEKECEKALLFELELSSCASILNDYWKSYKSQNKYYRKDKDRIDRVLEAYKSVGFDFSRNISEEDALKVGEFYCVIEFNKRTNNKRLYRTMETNDGRIFYFYKAKDDDAPSCIFSGLFIKCMIGVDIFESLKCCHRYKIY